MTVKRLLLFLLLLLYNNGFAVEFGNPLIEKGWKELVKDNENEAFRYFWLANQKAIKENNVADQAESYLYLGICSYGSSLEKGLQFATKSLSHYKKLEQTDYQKASIGRCKCLQLISTIYSRQKKYDAASKLSKEVVSKLKDNTYDLATLGLAYKSLGDLYEIKKRNDSSEVFYKLSLEVFEKSKNLAYLPSIYSKLGLLAIAKKQKTISLDYFKKAVAISENTENKQAQVTSLLGLGKWHLELDNNSAEAENQYQKAEKISKTLSDKLFEIKSIEALIEIKKKQNDFLRVSQLQQEIIAIKDKTFSSEREQIIKNLEVQFEVSEMNRKLDLLAKAKEVSRLTNYLLVSIIFLLLLTFFFFRRIYKRDKLLLSTKEQLVVALEEQKRLKELQFENDIEHKESQLSAIAFQMLQKNELLEEIKEIIHKKEGASEEQLSKLINSHFTSDNWTDFDKYFESINKNFYSKLKKDYPDISSNDLKVCALIKLNLSIKEMASILNISPDSVKTARYRLRKKLHLNSEDNLTDFILSI